MALEGVEQMARRLQEIVANAKRELEVAVYQEALVVQRLSMQLTPVLTGALRASHETKRPRTDGGSLVVDIVVGGPAAPYALYVHENLDAHHKVGQAKFLESAVLAYQPEFATNVGKRLGDKWGSL